MTPYVKLLRDSGKRTTKNDQIYRMVILRKYMQVLTDNFNICQFIEAIQGEQSLYELQIEQQKVCEALPRTRESFLINCMV